MGLEPNLPAWVVETRNAGGYLNPLLTPTFFKEVLAATLGRLASDIPTTASWTVTTNFIYNAAPKSSEAF